MFFGGVPGRILSAWNADEVSIVLSASILAEYREVGAELTARYGGTGFEPFAALLLMRSEVVDASEHLPEPVCADSADDKFLACALAGGAPVIVLATDTYCGYPDGTALTFCVHATSSRPTSGERTHQSVGENSAAEAPESTSSNTR